MSTNRRPSARRILTGNVVLVLLLIVVIAAIIVGLRVVDIWQEKERLRQALVNITAEEVIGYAKVLSVGPGTKVRIRFVECDRADRLKFINDRTVELDGNQVFCDLLIVKYQPELVMDGKERAMYLWRRVYTDSMSPKDGIQINEFGRRAPRYGDISQKLGFSAANEAKFWTDVWNLADDASKLASKGVTAINGNAVYRDFRQGRIYKLKLSATGAPTIDFDPDLSADETSTVKNL